MFLQNLVKKNKYLNLLKYKIPFPDNKFVIYTRGRTGSTVLTDLLNCHPDIFCDIEIFNFLYSKGLVSFPELYIKSCSKRAAFNKKQVYGFKVKIAQLRYEHKYSNYEKILSDLNSDGWKFIYLKRENFLRHKLSNIMSAQSQIFHIMNSDSIKTPKIRIDCNSLLEGIKFAEEVEKTEKENLRNIPHLTLTYESDIIDNSKHQETADKVFSYLNLKTSTVSTNNKRIIPDNLEDTILNYDEVNNFFKDTEYSKYLNEYINDSI